MTTATMPPANRSTGYKNPWGEPTPPLFEQQRITALEIEGFHAIREPIRIELRPITLLYGANGSGKSTVIQAIAYARQLLVLLAGDGDPADPVRPRYDPSEFLDLAHNHLSDPRVRLKLDMNLNGKPVNSVRKASLEIIGGWSKTRGKVVLKEFKLRVGDEIVIQGHQETAGPPIITTPGSSLSAYTAQMLQNICARETAREISGGRKIGPTRQLLARGPESANTLPIWWDGTAAWPLLEVWVKNSVIPPLKLRNVNEWLRDSDRLATGHSIRNDHTLKLIRSHDGQPAALQEPGTGISQILPVVVGIIDPVRPRITAIDKPEAGLHPRGQLGLGDLFASQIGRGLFLIETHSEHLLLRLQRRIRETTENTLPEDKPRLQLEDVSVNVLQMIDGTVKATRIRIDRDGDMVDNWPGGFFNERLNELR